MPTHHPAKTKTPNDDSNVTHSSFSHRSTNPPLTQPNPTSCRVQKGGIYAPTEVDRVPGPPPALVVVILFYKFDMFFVTSGDLTVYNLSVSREVLRRCEKRHQNDKLKALVADRSQNDDSHNVYRLSRR